jgi:L-arabinonolactonase
VIEKTPVEIDAVLSVRAALGECPVWDERLAVLYWIDIDAQVVHRTDPSTGADVVRRTPGRPGSVVLAGDPDRLIVAVEHRVVELRWSTGEVRPMCDVEPDHLLTRLNDGRCDAAGRFWVGSMDDPAGSGTNSARLHRIDPDGAVSEIEREVGVANGLAFSPDGTVMYWADTRRSMVWAYDYDMSTGARSKQRDFLDFSTLPGSPDGACVDADGCYWVACVYGWAVLRATPEGRVDRIIELPVEKPSMPAFGDTDFSTLFVTSISTGGSAPAQPGQPLAGALLAMNVGVRGLAEPHFAG